jgi:hypothetical protein
MALSHVTGWEIHKARLRRMREIADPAKQALLMAGEAVRADAQNSIRQGAVSGVGHVPSRPGEPPNADTHQLDISIDVVLDGSGKSVRVISRAPYSAALEYGHASLLPRPFMRPALIRNRNRLVRGMVQAVQSVVRVVKGR